MAVYKVPQNVEADDKLLGPFNFRQVIYLFIVAGALAVAWVLGNLFLPLAIFPIPIILFFGALALPLRKDQPMETYLAAMVSFFLKPRKRLWDPEGQQVLVEITAPRSSDAPYVRNISGSEAERRLSYLSSIADTRGWAVRGVEAAPTADNTSLNQDVFYEAQQTQDVMDQSNRTAAIINTQLTQADRRRHDELIARMHQQPTTAASQSPQEPTQPSMASLSQPPNGTSTQAPVFNPYPNIHQSVIQPLSSARLQPQPPQPQPLVAPLGTTTETTPSKKSVSPGIINLANNPDLSIETIAHEANRIKEKQSLPDDEVVISLH